jgi:predicted HTH domain antitoxin
MKRITLDIPDSLELDKMDAIMIIASKLYEQGKLSLGQAAELAGITKRSFAESLGNYGVSIFNYPASDFLKETRNA